MFAKDKVIALFSVAAAGEIGERIPHSENKTIAAKKAKIFFFGFLNFLQRRLYTRKSSLPTTYISKATLSIIFGEVRGYVANL